MQIIPTEPIGSIPRPISLIEGIASFKKGLITEESLDLLYSEAIIDTIHKFEETGSPIITDGEQRKYHNFATYSVDGLSNFAPDGFKLHFAAGHYQQWPRLISGPFRYHIYADKFLDIARKYSQAVFKQAVISPSALSLFYPAEEIPEYPRDQFISDMLNEHETEIKNCLNKGAYTVQVDFTEGRLSMKLDPTGNLLNSFIIMNNMALDRFSEEDQKKIGIHTCPGGDRDSTHSADVDYSELLPSLFELNAGKFFIALEREENKIRVLEMIKKYLKPYQIAYVGVIDPLNPKIDTPEEVRDRILLAAKYIPLDQLGTTDDCGFSPFSDDLSTSRETAFAKIKARVEGTNLASKILYG